MHNRTGGGAIRECITAPAAMRECISATTHPWCASPRSKRTRVNSAPPCAASAAAAPCTPPPPHAHTCESVRPPQQPALARGGGGGAHGWERAREERLLQHARVHGAARAHAPSLRLTTSLNQTRPHPRHSDSQNQSNATAPCVSHWPHAPPGSDRSLKNKKHTDKRQHSPITPHETTRRTRTPNRARVRCVLQCQYANAVRARAVT